MGPRHWYWKKRKASIGSVYGTPAYASSSVTMSFSTVPVCPTPIADRGLAIEPIVGARTFDVSTEGEIGIHSINGVYWPPRKALTAYCLNNPFASHDSPHLDCQCGIYAWTLNEAAGFPKTLWGEVYLWGDVIVCDLGYRAEFAYPKELHINATATRAAKRIRQGLEETYGVPVTLDDPDKPKEEIDMTTYTTTLTAQGGFATPFLPPGYPYPQIPPGPPTQGAGGL